MPTTVIRLPETVASPRAKTLFIVFRIVFWWLPKASPDYDRKGNAVVYWLVEVEDGRAEREIGFDVKDKPILHAPTDRNMGLWTDSDRVFTLAKYETVDAQEFDLLWQKLEKQAGLQSS
jgi:hypothetical protein